MAAPKLTLGQTKELIPVGNHAEFDKMVEGKTAEQQEAAGTFLQSLIAFLKMVGTNVNWGCVMSSLPLALTGNIMGAFMAYLACIGTIVPPKEPTPQPT